MNRFDLAERLMQVGLPGSEARAKVRLHALATTGLRELTAEQSNAVYWVPGRLEVFGKHTDYAGGRSLVCALPRGFVFAAARRSDAAIEVIDGRSGERLEVDGIGTKPGGPGWRTYVEAVVGRLSRNFPGARCGASIAFASDLPPASGMSSSSALVVGLALVLARIWNLPARAEWRSNVHGRADLATYCAGIESGAAFGSLAGNDGVGTHGGSEDHAAILLGRSGMLSAFSFVPLRHLDDVGVPDEWGLVIAASGVAAEKTGRARDDYNRLSQRALALLRLWQERTGAGYPSLAAALSSTATAGADLRELVQRQAPEADREELLRRLEHFLMEDGSIPPAVRAFAAADVGALRDLSERSQRYAEELLANQVPETAALARAARACGAFAACSFGAGFGGSVWALVERADAADFSARWLARYRANYPARTSATSFVAAAGPPATELSAEAVVRHDDVEPL